MFDSEKFISKVFKICLSVSKNDREFNSEQIIQEFDFPKENIGSQADYWRKKNVTVSLTVLEKTRLISGAIKPEFTPNFPLTKEVRYGKITWLGGLFEMLPEIFTCTLIFFYLQKQRIISILGVFAFVRLATNAYKGAEIISGWLEQVAAIILLYILYLLIKKIID